MHTEPFTQRDRGVFTQRRLNTGACLHRGVFYTEGSLHTEAFTQRGLTRRSFLHTDSFKRNRHTESFYKQNCSFTEKSLHRAAFAYRNSLAVTQTRFYTQAGTTSLMLIKQSLVILQPASAPFTTHHGFDSDHGSLSVIFTPSFLPSFDLLPPPLSGYTVPFDDVNRNFTHHSAFISCESVASELSISQFYLRF